MSRLRQASVAAIIVVGITAGCSAAGAGDIDRRVMMHSAGKVCPDRSAVPVGGLTDSYDRQVLSYAPSMYLTMAHAAAGTESDLSGHGHSGTYLPSGQRPAASALPNGDAAADFDGTGQYLQVSSASALSVMHTGCLTIQAWVKPDTRQFPREEGTGYVYILGKGAHQEQEYAMRMYSLVNKERPPRPNRVSAYIFNRSGGLGSGAYFQDRVQAGSWMMITMVIDAQRSMMWPDGYIAIYKDSRLRDQVSIGQFNVKPQSANAPLCIATRQLKSYFKGSIGKVAVFDYVLSAGRVKAIYNAMS